MATDCHSACVGELYVLFGELFHQSKTDGADSDCFEFV
jgi:hypothetical protein